MTRYNWQKDDWPGFTYSLAGLEDELFSFAERVGRISGIMHALPEEMQQEAIISMMLAEAIKTSEIEGEYLSREDVLSSLRKNLGLHEEAGYIKDRRAAGMGELMINVRNTWSDLLTEETLFYWHRMLMEGNHTVKSGGWRTHQEPMQVISGALGKEKVHFEAPPSEQVPEEMQKFISWFNKTAPGGENEIKNPSVRTAIAHLYFETIHPFEDGNGRIGRVIAEKALSQGIGRPVLLSLSSSIEADKKAYYNALKRAQRSNEITHWLGYFVRTIFRAQLQAEEQIDFTLKKVKFFDRFREKLNDRQLKVITRMLDEGPEGFEGGMSTRKYVGITRASRATATRDMQQLLGLGAFERIGKAGGRSTRYRVKLWNV